MHPVKNLLNRLLLLSISVAIFLFACKKEADPQNNSTDPFIGNWKLKGVIVNGQPTGVSNASCFKNSYLNVHAKEFIMYNSIPKNDGTCSENTGKSAWVKANGKYYEIEGDQRILLDLIFNDNNQTLRVNAPGENGQTVGLVYTK